MIEVKNLTKIYNSKSKSSCKALDNISFSIDDKGMVFICGKSGSGKSTLLNLIAGLDEITNGDIVVDGNEFSKLSLSQFDDYRNSYIGFVFQDFCLLDTFTVKENIKLSLNLLGEENDSLISNILKEVDLEGYENRYPKELSGGQRQRVSIARALIKNPKYILADEPTGNLDSETTIQILNLLKKLSKDKLVLIISHSMENAKEYGDRIIELSEGHIISDISKNKEEYKLIDNNIINIPYNVKLTKEELELVNEKINNDKCIIIQDDNKFKKSIQPVYNAHKNEIKKSKLLSLKSIFKLTKGFTKNYYLNLFFTALMVSLLVMMMVVTQVFTTFDGSYLIENSIKDDNQFILYKGYYKNTYDKTLTKNKAVNITDDEIDNFYNLGYEGNIYKLYAFNLAINQSGNYNHSLAYCNQLDYSNISSLYVEAGKGVLECDLDYLKKIYGDVEVLAGTLDETGKCELVVTDYFADALLVYRGFGNYENIINNENISMSLSSYNIKAIINTNYKERYSSLIENFNRLNNLNLKDKGMFLAEIQSSEEFINFYNEINNNLAVGYFIDGDFYEALKKDTTVSDGSWFNNVTIKCGDETLLSHGTGGKELDHNLFDGEIIINSGMIQKLYGVSVSNVNLEEFIGTEIQFEQYYAYNNIYDDPYSSKTYKIVGIKNSPAEHIHFSYNDYYKLYDTQVYTYALYFDNSETISKIYNPLNNVNLFSIDLFVDGIYTIMNIITIFNDFFKIITIALTVVCIVLLVSFGRKSIKRRMFEIGVIRALGGKNSDLYVVFLLQILSMLLLVCVSSFICLVFLDDYINKMLIENIILFIKNDIIRNIEILKYSPILIISNLLSISILTIIGSSVLMMMLRKIKPINIIRKNND